ncbi:lysine-sensitive aspartokinase 3 [Psychrobium sp. nBUS_13]|uniref:lysine-sensitive aspartokinase 3 n=1 Tax=Psychrobium sp. nBUS_13 TaxID=3395319 RepID=UPI003EB9E510
MNHKIAKFGGTSLANFEAMSRCADIVLSSQSTRIVVVSASSGVTNLLVSLSTGSLSATQRNDAIAKISGIQSAIATHLELSSQQLSLIDDLLEKVGDIATSIARLNVGEEQVRTQLTDQLLACGEQLSSTLFTQVLIERGVNAHWLDVRDVMRTSSDFGKATVCIDTVAQLASERMTPLLEKQVIVTQGFIGCDTQGNTTTLGRGGSDYSAALLGEATHCSQIDIWTDVTGIFTTDPRITAQAYALEEISFNEAAEMATFGAKVLHPSTLIPAMRCNIPVFVGSSRAPESGGTIVRNETESKPVYRAIALRREQTLLTVTSMDMLHAPGFLARVFTILAKYNLSVDLVTTSEVSVAITLDNTGSNSGGNSQISQVMLDELEEVCQVTIEKDLALVALIGNAIDTSYGVGTRLFATLHDVNVRMICQGASSHNLCFLVEERQATDVISRLHHAMFEQNARGVA